MKLLITLGIGIGISASLMMPGRAQTMFFRTVSTQATHIVSFSNTGMLTWSNSVPGAISAVESSPALLSNGWSRYVDPILVTGSVASVQIPVGWPEPVRPQKYLFEVSHENLAWARYYDGLYLEHSGFVYRYRNDPLLITDPTNGVYPAAFLDEKTAINRRYVGTETRPQLNSMLALVDAAGQGQLSQPRAVGADQGVRQFKAFVFNPQQTNYSVILLMQDGDWTITNSAPEAAILTQWLSNWWSAAYR